jgi:hypothetical protein
MKKRPFTLTDFEDRALAACDDMYLETTITRTVLSTWYGRVISMRELRSVYRRLGESGLLRTYVRYNERITSAEMLGHRRDALCV